MVRFKLFGSNFEFSFPISRLKVKKQKKLEAHKFASEYKVIQCS